jgi:hypothetical protein
MFPCDARRSMDLAYDTYKVEAELVIYPKYQACC